MESGGMVRVLGGGASKPGAGVGGLEGGSIACFGARRASLCFPHV